MPGRTGPSTRPSRHCIYADPPYIFPGRSADLVRACALVWALRPGAGLVRAWCGPGNPVVGAGLELQSSAQDCFTQSCRHSRIALMQHQQLRLGAVLARAQPCDGAGPAVEASGTTRLQEFCFSMVCPTRLEGFRFSMVAQAPGGVLFFNGSPNARVLFFNGLSNAPGVSFSMVRPTSQISTCGGTQPAELPHCRASCYMCCMCYSYMGPNQQSCILCT